MQSQRVNGGRAMQMNPQLVLQIIQTKGPVSRKEISETTGLSPAAVSDITGANRAWARAGSRWGQGGWTGGPEGDPAQLECAGRLGCRGDPRDRDRLLRGDRSRGERPPLHRVSLAVRCCCWANATVLPSRRCHPGSRMTLAPSPSPSRRAAMGTDLRSDHHFGSAHTRALSHPEQVDHQGTHRTGGERIVRRQDRTDRQQTAAAAGRN